MVARLQLTFLERIDDVLSSAVGSNCARAVLNIRCLCPDKFRCADQILSDCAHVALGNSAEVNLIRNNRLKFGFRSARAVLRRYCPQANKRRDGFGISGSPHAEVFCVRQ